MEVTAHASAERVMQGPKEGAYVDGLFMEGARWDADARGIAESQPKVLFSAMPVLYVSAVDSKNKSNNNKAQTAVVVVVRDAYECPVYKYRCRQDRFHIFTVPLPSAGRRPAHWVLRAVALLCSKD